jgi:murein DD-endopeptidase MepM/ murein hydrolase activator NlpD
VVLAEPLTVRGNAVIVDHGLGVHTGYWHLSRIDVAAGQVVKVGDAIGQVGTTGLSTGSHLHWELRIGDVPVDPMEWTRRTIP